MTNYVPQQPAFFYRGQKSQRMEITGSSTGSSKLYLLIYL